MVCLFCASPLSRSSLLRDWRSEDTHRGSEPFGKRKAPWEMRSTKFSGILWNCSQLNRTKSYLKTSRELSVTRTRRSLSLFQWSTLRRTWGDENTLSGAYIRSRCSTNRIYWQLKLPPTWFDLGRAWHGESWVKRGLSWVINSFWGIFKVKNHIINFRS